MFAKRYIFLVFLLLVGFCQAQTINWSKLAQDQEKCKLSDPQKSIDIGENIVLHSGVDTLNAITYQRLGSAYLIMGNIKEALKNCKIAKYELNKYDIDNEFVILNDANLVSIYAKLQLYDKCKDLIDGMFDIIGQNKSNNDNFLLSFAYTSKAILSSEQKNQSECIDNCLKALKQVDLFHPTDDVSSLQKNQQTLNILYRLAEIYNKNENYKLAEEYALKALPFTVLSDNPTMTVSIKNILADGYQCTNRPQKAIDLILEYKDNKEIATAAQLNLNYVLSNSYKSLNDFKKSDYYGAKVDSIMQVMNKSVLQTSKDLIKIAEDEKEQEKKDAFRNKIIFISVVLTLLLFMLLIYLFLRAKYRKQRIQEYNKFQEIIQRYENQDIITDIESDTETDTTTDDIPVLEEIEEIKIEKRDDKEFISPEMENYIVDQLSKFEKSKKFLQKDLTLAKLASILKVNTMYLSHVINGHKQKNFNTYINELRINYISKLIYENPKYTTYKISYLADLAGFSTHSAFATVFKSITGISPSSYISLCKKKELS